MEQSNQPVPQQEQVTQPTPRQEHTETSALAFLFNIVGVLTIAAGVFGAKSLATTSVGYYDSTDYPLMFVYMASGVLCGLWNFALAVIVDACNKYRKNH